MNVSAASGRSITSLRLTRDAFGFAQQRPWDAVLDGRSKLRGIDPQRFKSVEMHKCINEKCLSISLSTSPVAAAKRWRLFHAQILCGWSLLLTLSACSNPIDRPPVDLQLYQQWQLQPGDTIAGRSVTGGLGDISIQLDGNPVYAPFDGKVDPTQANCVLFSSADVPGYLFRFCGLTAPKLGDVDQGDPIGAGNHLEFATLRKQSDGRWAMVEPAKSILERILQQP